MKILPPVILHLYPDEALMIQCMLKRFKERSSTRFPPDTIDNSIEEIIETIESQIEDWIENRPRLLWWVYHRLEGIERWWKVTNKRKL